MTALALPFGSKIMVDEVFARGRQDLLVTICLFLISALAVEAGTAFSLSQVLGAAGHRAAAHTRRVLHECALRLPMSFYPRASMGALAARISADSEQIQFILSTGLVSLVSGVMTTLLGLGFLVWLDARLAVFLGLMLIVGVGWLVRDFGRLYPAYRQVGDMAAELTGLIAERLGSIHTVRAYCAERREAYQVARRSHLLARASSNATAIVSRHMAGSTLCLGSAGLMVLLLGGRLVLDGSLSIGDLVLCLTLSPVLWNPLVQLAATSSQLGRTIAALGRVAEIRRQPSEETKGGGRRAVEKIRGTIDFRGVSFGYQPGRMVLRDVSFSVPAGSLVALVGPTGAGKTTLCHLIASLLPPTHGKILVDGQDLARIRLRDYRRQLGLVLQGDGQLFSATIEDNIAYGRPSATIKEILEAARLAHCDSFVTHLPAGYRTIVGPGGAGLSGGERQRVTIARALLANPVILILDEATNQLDSESEFLVHTALGALRRGRTTFVITHRLATVKAADQILVLDAGGVAERGSHEALMRQAGLYWRMCISEPRERWLTPDWLAEGRGEGPPKYPGEPTHSAPEPHIEMDHGPHVSH